MREEHYQNHIQGMLCRQCEDAVCQVLNSQRGILSSKSSFAKGTVEVIYDAGIIGPTQIEDVLEAAGYPTGRKQLKQYGIEFIFLVMILGFFFVLKSLKCISLPTMEDGASLWMVFLVGLLTGTHCISMCGGIALSLIQPQLNQRNSGTLKSILPYHAGRLITSTLLGMVFGAAGGVFNYSVKVKSMVFTLLGLAMIVVALRMWGIFPWLRELDALIPSFCKFPAQLKKRVAGKAVLVGLLTGIMPCGASYSMWLYAASTGNAVSGALVMFLWCFATIPLQLAFCMLGRAIPVKYGKWMTLANVLLILLFGSSMMFGGIRVIT